MSCSIYHEPSLLCPLYFSLWECIKEKDPLSSTRRCPSPTCREGKTRKTRTIFSPERKEDQEDQENSSHLFPRKPIRVRKPGQEIGFLLEVAAPLAALRSIQRTMGSHQAFCLCQAFQHGPVPHSTQITWRCKALFCREMISLLRRIIVTYKHLPPAAGQLGCYSHKHSLYRHGWNQQEQLKVWLKATESVKLHKYQPNPQYTEPLSLQTCHKILKYFYFSKIKFEV